MINNKIILSAISNSLFKTPFEIDIKELALSIEDWVEIIRESTAQTVSMLVLDGLNEVKEYLPQQLYMSWMQHTFSIINRNERINTEQKQLIELLNNNNIPYTILKGTTAAYNYPKPDLRNLGDIDFLIKPEDKDITKQLLLNHNYILNGKEGICHLPFKKFDISVEMHYEINGIPNGSIGDYLRNILSDAINSSEEVAINENKFLMPPPHIQGLILILHMVHHLLEVGIGLRHLCDWAVFVHKQLDDGLWNAQYKQILTESGLLDFTYAITWTCVKHLGLPVWEWMKPVDNEICENIINDIFKSGNFGRKDKSRSKSSLFTFNSRDHEDNPSLIYRYNRLIKNMAHNHWAIVDKIPFIIIFGYIYFPIRYLFLTIIGKRPKLSYNKFIADVNERDNTYSKLNIFKINNKD